MSVDSLRFNMTVALRTEVFTGRCFTLQVHAQKAFTGGNQRTGKGKWAKAIPGAVKEPDIFERIKEFSFDSLTSDQLSAARYESAHARYD